MAVIVNGTISIVATIISIWGWRLISVLFSMKVASEQTDDAAGGAAEIAEGGSTK